MKTYNVSHPDLDGPLIIDSNWSSNVTRMFAWRHLSEKFPGWDVDPSDLDITEDSNESA